MIDATPSTLALIARTWGPFDEAVHENQGNNAADSTPWRTPPYDVVRLAFWHTGSAVQATEDPVYRVSAQVTTTSLRT